MEPFIQVNSDPDAYVFMPLQLNRFLQFSKNANKKGDHFWMAAELLLCAGIFVFFIATLCSCGAIKENSHIILTVSISFGIESTIHVCFYYNRFHFSSFFFWR